MIFITFTFNHERLRLSSGLSIPVKAWDAETQRAKPAKDYVECNRKLREISKFLFDKYDELFPHKSVFNETHEHVYLEKYFIKKDHAH